MNYLAHAVLSFGDAEILCGNMMGDFVKGTAAQMSHFPEGIQKGLMLHRHIDTFTDQHSAIRSAKQIFRPEYGLYSGAVVDTVMDYFIANDEQLFANTAALQDFVDQVHVQLAAHAQYFPARFDKVYQSMLQHNWLFHYRHVEGIQQSLKGLARKAQHIKETDTAFALFNEHIDELNAHYRLFIDELICFVSTIQ
jgi:acyl carrier protein phosphodiesterase